MTDSCSGYSLPQLLACLEKYGPELSAIEVAHLDHVSVRQVMCVINNAKDAWWLLEPVAGDYPGFKYRKRPILNAKGKPIKSVGIYDDSGIHKQSSRMPLASFSGEGYGKQRHGY